MNPATEPGSAAQPPQSASRGGARAILLGGARRVWQARHWVVASAAFLVLGGTLVSVSQAYSRDSVRAAAEQRGPGVVRMVEGMQELVGRLAGVDERTMNETTNLFYNRLIGYRDDQSLWGQVDYWASPLETFSKGRGDCEDYAIAKYFTLLAEGVPASKLRMVYVKADLPAGGGRPAESVGHMVLAYYAEPGQEPLILDNLTDEIRPASQRPDLKPVFSFNTEGLWQGVGQQSAGDPMARISKWRDVMNRIKADGF